MPERTAHDLSHPAEAPLKRRFTRTLFGYRRRVVDEAMTRLELQVEELEGQAVSLREELLETQHELSETRHDLTRARAELRYWNDRASYVDSEVARARQRAKELEESARARAEAIEADAQERSLQLVDRVCSEANAMLQHAREEAREMFLRFEQDVDLSHQKLEKLERVRSEVARTMQGALQQFEEAVRELDSASPTRRIVETVEPVERRMPTFGKQKAMAAAKRFEDAAAANASAALSTPLTATVVNEQSTEAAADTAEPSDAKPATAEPAVGEETQVTAALQVDDPVHAVDPAAGDEVVVDEDASTPSADTSAATDDAPKEQADRAFVSLLANL